MTETTKAENARLKEEVQRQREYINVLEQECCKAYKMDWNSLYARRFFYKLSKGD